MKVRCILAVPRGYLTHGKVYDVTAREGDKSKVFPGRSITDPNGFEVKNDNGYYTYCLFKDCAHATWEIVE